jgi:Kef-type K+ transport system membrane component KefB
VAQVPDDENDRRFVNNPFARALHPATERRTVAQWIALVLVSIFAFVVMGAAFVLPLAFGYGLLARSHGRIGMIAAGVVAAAVYVAIIASLLRKRRKAARR